MVYATWVFTDGFKDRLMNGRAKLRDKKGKHYAPSTALKISKEGGRLRLTTIADNEEIAYLEVPAKINFDNGDTIVIDSFQFKNWIEIK